MIQDQKLKISLGNKAQEASLGYTRKRGQEKEEERGGEEQRERDFT